MRDGRAETVAEAEAQRYTLPARLDDWRQCAALIDGYKIAKELDFELIPWANEQGDRWRASGTWGDLSLLELRLMLFAAFRADYMGGYTYHEYDEIADSLLHAISAKTGLLYPSGEEDSFDGKE
jgi:hypothetical protein